MAGRLAITWQDAWEDGPPSRGGMAGQNGPPQRLGMHGDPHTTHRSAPRSSSASRHAAHVRAEQPQERRALGDDTRHITQRMVGTLSTAANMAQIICIRVQHLYAHTFVRARTRMLGSTCSTTSHVFRQVDCEETTRALNIPS